MREVSFQRGYLLYPDGSCLASYGNTKVICTAVIEEKVPKFLEGQGRGWISAEYAMLPGSTSGGRKRRELLKKDGRSTEIQRLIGRSLRAAVHLDRLGEVSIQVDCDVIQADGGTRTAAISGSYVALRDALTSLAESRGVEGPDHFLKGSLGAVSVGIVEGRIVCDLDYRHDSQAEVDMNVVQLDDRLVEVQGAGEQGTFSRQELNSLLDSAAEGIAEVFAAQKAAFAGRRGR
ncbi:MAG TPA: ribonuclease PH [Sediminispirochaeta sp.]|nr:ribonuclease PH [Sediminispirochaeta sp.]